MKTTIDIPEKLLKAAMKFTLAKTKSEAVVKVLEEYNRKQRMAGLVKHFGTFKSMITNDEIEALEIKL